MNSSRLYKWEPGTEHAWIAEDVDGYLAYMTCCIDGALPDKVNIDRRMLSGLDLRLKALFDSEQCKVSDWFESFAAFGFFVYDAVRVKNGGFAFRLVARPKVPTKADKLPESLRSVAMVFSVEGVRFGDTELLPACNLFAHNGEEGSFLAQTDRGIGIIRRVANPRVSILDSAGCFAAKEYVERGYIDLHAVLGFTDVVNKVATVFEWGVYERVFASLLDAFLRMKGVDAVNVQLDGSGWQEFKDDFGISGMFDAPPSVLNCK